MNNIFGYIRVSTREQNEGRRLFAMRKMAIPEANIYTDKQSGKNFNRPQYRISFTKKYGKATIIH